MTGSEIAKTATRSNLVNRSPVQKQKKDTISSVLVVAGTALQTSIDFQLLIRKGGQKGGQVHFAFTFFNLFELNHFGPFKTCI